MTIAKAALLAPPSSGDFREVLAHLASVAIVSCWDGEQPRGLLVSSITGLSVDPPRFLATDRDEAHRFGGPALAQERFKPERWRLEAGAPPTYRHGMASADCAIDEIVEAQTHSIFIVTATRHDQAPAAPLIAWNRTLIAVD